MGYATPKARKYCSQKCSLQALQSLWQTQSHRFKPGGKAWNEKHRDLPRDAQRRPLIPCTDCGHLISLYPTRGKRSGRCKSCSFAFRRNTPRTRIWKNGYVYKEGGDRPIPEHIRKAERVLGRALGPKEVVHH